MKGPLFALAVIPALAGTSYYKDVSPILEKHCLECHRPGEAASMSFLSYGQTRPWAKAIRDAVKTHRMPPWFADPCCGHFANDRSLSAAEVETLVRWADSGALAGDPKDASPPRIWPQGWNLATRDLELQIPVAFVVPKSGDIEYQYFTVPTGLDGDRWVQAVEVRPGSRLSVHHIVVYIRERGSTWTHGPTKSDILAVYTPGSSPDVWPDGMAKLLPAGSDLVFEIHYTTNGKPGSDRSAVAMTFAKSPPAKRILTLQLGNDHFLIPAGESDFRVSSWGSLPNDALLLGIFPHMHLRGKKFEFDRIRSDGLPEPLLRVEHYDFYWQLSYRFKTPLPLKAGTRLECMGWFDNSPNNPRNPDATADVSYGQQSRQEMMIGFFDVAVDAGIGKPEFFVRPSK